MAAQTTNTIYGNCCVLSPTGILMFKCTEKKVNWYIKRELADIITDKPLTIQLKFHPGGLGNHEKGYGLDTMFNKCVNCGSEEDLTRHHVVPICYRRYFPLEIKSHNFHDILPMCLKCHEKYERKADMLKNKIGEIYKSPLNGKVLKDDIKRWIKISRVLLEYNIPNDRRIELRNLLKKNLNIKRLTNARIKRISRIDIPTTRCIKTHGEIVIEQINNINSFIEMWRTHFIENNECNFLPSQWDIKNGII